LSWSHWQRNGHLGSKEKKKAGKITGKGRDPRTEEFSEDFTRKRKIGNGCLGRKGGEREGKEAQKCKASSLEVCCAQGKGGKEASVQIPVRLGGEGNDK